MVSESDVAATVADALVTADDLSPLVDLFAIARETRRGLFENLALALLVLIVAAALMDARSLLVLGNSYRSIDASV